MHPRVKHVLLDNNVRTLKGGFGLRPIARLPVEDVIVGLALDVIADHHSADVQGSSRIDDGRQDLIFDIDEFQRVTREVGLGLTPEEALANLVRRINSMDLELMVTAINVQREVGGNLAEILDIIANTIRERVKLQGEIKTLTAQQTMAGYVITGLPIVLFFFLYTIDPKYMSTFWTWIPCGLIMGLGSIVMMGIGYFVMRKIVAIEV